MGKGSVIRKTQENRLKDGRGQGYGIEYKPFIQASDNKAPSDGYLIRGLGWITKRIHHTMSKVEYDYLMVLSWSDQVVDLIESGCWFLLPLQSPVTCLRSLKPRTKMLRRFLSLSSLPRGGMRKLRIHNG